MGKSLYPNSCWFFVCVLFFFFSKSFLKALFCQLANPWGANNKTGSVPESDIFFPYEIEKATGVHRNFEGIKVWNWVLHNKRYKQSSDATFICLLQGSEIMFINLLHIFGRKKPRNILIRAVIYRYWECPGMQKYISLMCQHNQSWPLCFFSLSLDTVKYCNNTESNF